jgi:hypothetical protein
VDPNVRPTLGDVTQDGSVDNSDSQRILFFVGSGLEPGIDMSRSDLDRNGLIDNADSQHVMNFFSYVQDLLPAD